MQNTVVGVFMIVVGLGFVSGGIVVAMRRPSDVQAALPVSEPVPIEGTVSTPSEERHVTTSGEKGLAFEQWVFQRFDRNYFTIKDWRSDKSANGNFAESAKYPDFEIEFRLRDKRFSFAVECKWRKEFQKGEKPYITWADDRQIENYRGFSKAKAMPVFVVIGVGGEPDDPAEVFILKLDNLKYSKATDEYLARYRRSKRDAKFFYDETQRELK
jgi:hypothetical protein